MLPITWRTSTARRSSMILVSGGTGFVGSAIVRELLRRGERVAVLGRDGDKAR